MPRVELRRILGPRVFRLYLREQVALVASATQARSEVKVLKQAALMPICQRATPLRLPLLHGEGKRCWFLPLC